jgi:hypothetical protein
MTARSPKNSFRFCAVLASLAVPVLFAGCWLEKPIISIEYGYANVFFQATVKNKTSEAISVSLLPAIGSRKDSIYHWAVGSGEIYKHPDIPTEQPVTLADNSEQVLRTYFGKSAYDGFRVGDEILSFLLQIDGNEYAGWNIKKYGAGSRTLAGQGYGYAVLFEDSRFDVYWHSSLLPGNEYTARAGFPENVTVRYTITIADDGVAFALDEVAYCVRESPMDFQNDTDPDGG